MNLPNKLTLVRVVMIPILIAVYLLRALFPAHYLWIMGIIFLAGALTDYFDGAKIGRASCRERG